MKQKNLAKIDFAKITHYLSDKEILIFCVNLRNLEDQLFVRVVFEGKITKLGLKESGMSVDITE